MAEEKGGTRIGFKTRNLSIFPARPCLQVSCVYHSEEAENQYLRGWMSKDGPGGGMGGAGGPSPAAAAAAAPPATSN